MSIACPTCPPSQLDAALAEAGQYLSRIAGRVGTISSIDQDLARRVARKLYALSQTQADLSGALAYSNKQTQLGIIATLAIGGGLLVTAIAGLIWKQREQTKELDTQLSIYEKYIADGLDPDTAAKLSMGKYTMFTDVVKGIAVLAGIGVAVYLIIKLK